MHRVHCSASTKPFSLDTRLHLSSRKLQGSTLMLSVPSIQSAVQDAGQPSSESALHCEEDGCMCSPTISGFLSQFHVELRPKVDNRAVAQTLEELVEAGRRKKGELVPHQAAFLHQVLIDPPEMCDGVLVLLAVFLGRLLQLLVALDLDHDDQIAGFDEEVGVELAALRMLAFFPRRSQFRKNGLLWI